MRREARGNTGVQRVSAASFKYVFIVKEHSSGRCGDRRDAGASDIEAGVRPDSR